MKRTGQSSSHDGIVLLHLPLWFLLCMVCSSEEIKCCGPFIFCCGLCRFESLRSVPAYEKALREGFDRCLDLYLCPRTRKKRVSGGPIFFLWVYKGLHCLGASLSFLLWCSSLMHDDCLIIPQINIDPESLKPKLPSKKDLRPYPKTCYLEFKGHSGPVRSLSVEATGQWIASGMDCWYFFRCYSWIYMWARSWWFKW